MKNFSVPKLYYSIKEVCAVVDEEQYILRYWEREFEQLNPKKNRAGNRVYSLKDLDVVKCIKRLLREELMSVATAKEAIRSFDFHGAESTTSIANISLQDENQDVEIVEQKSKVDFGAQRSILESMLDSLKKIKSRLEFDTT